MKNYLTFGNITSAIAISVTAITLTGCSLLQLPTISTDQIYSSLRNKDNTTNVEPADNDSDKDELSKLRQNL